MNYRHLPLKCQCGEVPDHITEVGFSDDHQLVIHWFCSTCRKLVYVVKPLVDCWRECPSTENSLEARLEVLETASDEKSRSFSFDLQFLRSVGVKPC
jgi:hypothetical protein